MKERVLIVGPAWVGDMVMAQSLFKLLKQTRPGVQLDVLAPPWSMPILARMPEVSLAIPLAVAHGELKWRERYQRGRSLRENHYDQAILLPNSFKSALIPWWANIPKRTGWLGEMRYGLLNDIRRLDKARYPLMIERFLALGLPAGSELLKPYPLPELQVNLTARAAAITRYQLVTDKKILILCPGAEFGPAKRWPTEHYAELANRRLQKGWSVWLMGSPKDVPVSLDIMALTAHQCTNLTGQTSLCDAIDILSLATLVISNDSGLMHVAAALHRPLIALYGPTSATFTPPLHDQARVVSEKLDCQPCFQRTCPLKHGRCMTSLLPETILGVMHELVGKEG